ncbi:ABC transporter permease [Mediterraneibacter gnavus]|uniref:ABC transporter permease n=2 Tax=Lachnospirales TaxID=3085636 RepID=UPI0036D3F459
MTAISNIKISTQEKNKKLTPISLGIMNFKREQKKVWSIVISLSLGGIILLTVSSTLLLQSPEKMAQHYFGDADYKIYIKSDKEPTELLYSGNPLNDNLKEEIGSIPGINEIQTLRKSATFTFEYKGYGGRGMCDMITTQNKKEIEYSLIAGRMPENSHEILVKTGYKDLGEEVKVGMQFEISFGKGKIPVTVSGIFQSTKFASALGSGRAGFNAAMMCMTEDAFKELLPGLNNFDFTWGINIDQKEQSSVDENLRNTISKNEDIAIESFSERVDGYEKDNTIYFILQVISILIFLFGVINLINTTLSNQLFRRREYSVLRSIGLTEKQLYKVIISEGMCYSILSVCMTLLIGTPIAMLICRQMSIGCYGKVVEYSFPFFYMSIYVLVLLLIQVILSIYQIREQKKKSIIDQLRME